MADLSSLLQARYGTPQPAAEISAAAATANPTLATILNHKSVRDFAPAPIPAGTLEILLAAGQSAATSSNLQTWSVVAVEDPERKSQAAALSADQAFIRKAPLFLLFLADLSRLTQVSAQEGEPGVSLAYTEMFLMASLDAAFAAQNITVAAESLGLGGCYVGASRNNPRELAALLGLPPRVVGLFGLALGYPDAASTAAVKPRLSLHEVLHRECWRTDDEAPQKERFRAYDKVLNTFNASQGRADTPAWTRRSAVRVATEEGMHGRHALREILQERGFELQ